MDEHPNSPQISKETFEAVEESIQTLCKMLQRMVPINRRPKPQSLAQINATAKVIAGLLRAIRSENDVGDHTNGCNRSYYDALMMPSNKHNEHQED